MSRVRELYRGLPFRGDHHNGILSAPGLEKLTRGGGTLFPLPFFSSWRLGVLARDHQCSQLIPSWQDWHCVKGSSSSGVAGRTCSTFTAYLRSWPEKGWFISRIT